MIALGLMNLIGKKFTLPMIHLTVDLNKNNNPWGVYTMGVFSGITSSCCTPVLAGILTLTFLSPSFFWATLAGFSYVAGMVTPLVILAILLEKINWSKLTKLRTTTVSPLGRRILLTDAIAGVIFGAIGVLFIYLASTGQIVMESQSVIEQTIGVWMINFARIANQLPGSEYLFLFVIGLAIIYLVKRVRK